MNNIQAELSLSFAILFNQEEYLFLEQFKIPCWHI